MSSREPGRKLRVLVIDDEVQERMVSKKGAFASHLEIVPIRSWGDAQVLVANETTRGGADILLVDISLEKDTLIAKAISDSSESIILPAGPLLALPFIGQRSVMACVIYSGHLSNPLLQSHPFFLLAMGLIAARTVGLGSNAPLRSAWLDHQAGKGSLDQIIAEMHSSGPQNVGSALDAALEEYRDRLLEMILNGEISLANREELDSRLQEMIQKADKDGQAVIDDSIVVDMVGKKWADRISLSSLFADTLNYSGTKVDYEWLQERRKWLHAWSESSFERAWRVVQTQEERSTEGGELPDAEALVMELYAQSLSNEDLTEVFRLVVVFANVYAFLITGGSTKQGVFTRLGPKVEFRRYYGWFGERDKTAKKKGKLKPLRCLAVGNDTSKRCFLQTGSVIDAEDRDVILKYLQVEECGEGIVLPYEIRTKK